MFYCDRCKSLSEQDKCRCGRKNLKAPKNEDFCFLTEQPTMYGEMFKGIMKEEGIPFADYPSGNGVRTVFALRLENTKIFVPYEFYEQARELLNDVFEESADEDEEGV